MDGAECAFGTMLRRHAEEEYKTPYKRMRLVQKIVDGGYTMTLGQFLY